MSEPAFQGFAAPTSNTTYVPNQFFDVVLREARNTGVIRVVAFMLRKTLGWCDADGNAQETEILTDYKQLIHNGGICRAKVRAALDEAERLRYISCVREGRSKTQGRDAMSALFEIKWDDDGDYTTDPGQFSGFFSSEGNRTYIPNQYLDHVVPGESLAVIKVVGAIIRHTIGFQSRLGFRRQQVAVSYSDLQRITGIKSRTSVSRALTRALEQNYILKVEQGAFDGNAGVNSKASTYGIRWQDQGIGSQCGPGGSVHKLDRVGSQTGPGGSVHKLDRVGSQTGPGDRFTNWTGIEIKQINKTKQTTAAGKTAAAAGVVLLVGFGFEKRDAQKIASGKTTEQIAQQIDWLPLRKPRTPLGCLRKAIELDWPDPREAGKLRTSVVSDREQATDIRSSAEWRFAQDFYAGYHGSEEALAEPYRKDPQHAQALLAKLVELDPAQEWGRGFGEFVQRAHRNSPGAQPFLSTAITQHGSKFLNKEKAKRATGARRAKDKAQTEDLQAAYLRQCEARLTP